MADCASSSQHGSAESYDSVALDAAMIELVEKLSLTPEPLRPLTDGQMAGMPSRQFPPPLDLQQHSSSSSSTASSTAEPSVTTPVTMLFPLPPTTAAGAGGRPPPLAPSINGHKSSENSGRVSGGSLRASEGSIGGDGSLTSETGDQLLPSTPHTYDFSRLPPPDASTAPIAPIDTLTVSRVRSGSSPGSDYPPGLLSPICIDFSAPQGSDWSHSSYGDTTPSSLGPSPISPLGLLSPAAIPDKDGEYRSMVMFGRHSFGVTGTEKDDPAIAPMLHALAEEPTESDEANWSVSSPFPQKRRSVTDVEEIMADDLNDLRDAFLPPTQTRPHSVGSRSASRTKSVGSFKLLSSNKHVPGHGTPSTYTVKSGRKMGRRPPTMHGNDENFLEIWSAPPLRALVEAETSIVRDENGRAVHFGDLLPEGSITKQGSTATSSPKVVIIFLRHFWCPLGQDYMVRSIAQLDQGTLKSHNTRVILIAPGSWKLIKKYRKLCHCPYPMYSDSSRHIYKLMGLMDFAGDERYQRTQASSQTLKSLRKGFLKLPGDPGSVRQLGGEFIFGAGNACEFAHRMTTPNDHLEASAVLRTAGVEMPTVFRYGSSTLSSIGNGVVCIDRERKGSWETTRLSDVGSISEGKRPTKVARESATWDKDTEEYVESLGPMSMSSASSHHHSTSTHQHQSPPQQSVSLPEPIQELEPMSPTRPVKSPLRTSLYQQQLQHLQHLQDQQALNVQTISNHYNRNDPNETREKSMSTWSSSSSSEAGIVTTPKQQKLPPIEHYDFKGEQKEKEYDELVRRYRAQKWGLAYEAE